MLVTVAICTWNRAGLLDRVLAELQRLRIPEAVRWEVVIVDNACTDDTPSVTERHAERLPLRRVLESQPGTSHARTRALREARGELLLFTDDDVLVDPNWLAAYVEAAERHPYPAFFGGPVEPWFLEKPPSWLAGNLSVLAGAFALRENPKVEFLTEQGHLPFAANLALRRSAFEGRSFDPALGQKGQDGLRGEEVSFLEELVHEGHCGMWVEAARVRHLIPKERQTIKYLRHFYYGKGRVRVRRGDELPPRSELLRKYRKARTRSWLVAPLRNERWARDFKAAAQTKGTLDELRNRGVTSK